MSRRTRAPRRRIERIATQVVQNSMPTAGKTIVIHTAEDSKTLVRILADLYLGYLVNNIDDRYDTVDLVLSIQPIGVQVAPGSLSAVADRVVGTPEIARWTVPVKVVSRGTDGFWQFMPHIHADISAMRKMKETDKLVLSVIASTNDNEVKLDGNIYAWFKE